MRSRVELFEQIRRDHDREGLSKRALAARYGVHRRTVGLALGSAVPPPRKRPEGRLAPKLGEYRELIDSWLIADREAPLKQRHTARRVWERLRDEHGVEVSERQVRRYVRERRRALGLPVGEVCVPLCHEPAGEAEVDWGEAKVLLAGVLVKVYLFLMRACFSGACFVQAFGRETQQAFLEAHVQALEWFDGCFGVVRYDNLGSAVKTVLKGRRRVETDRFIALRSHYLYEASFTRVGKQGAHEKGGVEGGVGWWRRRYLVPVPAFASLAELNDHLAVCMIEDLSRTIRGREVTIGQALSEEIELLRPLPKEPFDSFEQRSRSPGSGSPPGSGRGRSLSATTGGRSPAIHACWVAMASAPGLTTTWSCFSASPGRCGPRCRCAKSASKAAGPSASISCGGRSKRRSGPPRPPARWSTC
jgi:transposase